MCGMIKLVARILIAVVVALLIARLGVAGNPTVLQTLFTVLGIVFSISMSLLVSFGLSKILNGTTRSYLRTSIIYTRNMLLLDFGISTLCMIVALIWRANSLVYLISGWTIDVMLIGVCVVTMSLMYEIYNFRKLHRLHTDIEDAVIKEEAARG